MAADLAKELTDHPTIPESLLEGTQTAEEVARSGKWLGLSACAFKGCKWQLSNPHFSDLQARDFADHPWDQCLKAHVYDAHSQAIDHAIKVHFDKPPSKDVIWDLYCQAVGVQERKKFPIVGPSVDRRSFAYTAAVHNDERTHAYMCFVCGGNKVDTGRARSDIEMKSARWVFSHKLGAVTKHLSFGAYRKLYAKPGTPLHASGSGAAHDVDSPDFSDWRLYLTDDFPVDHWCSDSANTGESNWIADVQELREEGLLCCPEDHRCKHGCPAKQRFCPECEVPVCRECQLCMGKNEKSPIALTNDHWYGYPADWILKEEVTWMEKTVASPFWTGLTVFTIGTHGQERKKIKKHLMNEPMFQNPVLFVSVAAYNSSHILAA